MNDVHNVDCLGNKLLILGDINTGKTTLCRQRLDTLCQQGLGGRISLVDLSPCIPEALALERGIVGAGGRLIAPPASGVLDLRAHLDAPRLSSASEAEAMTKAERNLTVIDALLEKLPCSGRDILFINDATLYLQAGSAAKLLRLIAKADIQTLVINGYWGDRLGGGELTRREKAETLVLRQFFAQAGTVLELTHCYR